MRLLDYSQNKCRYLYTGDKLWLAQFSRDLINSFEVYLLIVITKNNVRY